MKKIRDCQECGHELDSDDCEYDGWELSGQLCRMCFSEIYENEDRAEWYRYCKEGQYSY